MPCAALQKAATVIASAAGRHGGGFSPDPYDTNLGSPIGHAAYEMKRFVGLGCHGGGFMPDPYAYDTNLGSPFGHTAYEMKSFVGLGCDGLLSDDIVVDESRSGAAVVEMCCGMRCAPASSAVKLITTKSITRGR